MKKIALLVLILICVYFFRHTIFSWINSPSVGEARVKTFLVIDSDSWGVSYSYYIFNKKISTLVNGENLVWRKCFNMEAGLKNLLNDANFFRKHPELLNNPITVSMNVERSPENSKIYRYEAILDIGDYYMIFVRFPDFQGDIEQLSEPFSLICDD